MCLQVMALPADIYSNGELGKKQYIVSGMRGVAGCAVSLLYGPAEVFIFRVADRLLLKLHCILMTLSADRDNRSRQKILLPGRMCIMAVQTACFIEERPVDAVLV